MYTYRPSTANGRPQSRLQHQSLAKPIIERSCITAMLKGKLVAAVVDGFLVAVVPFPEVPLFPELLLFPEAPLPLPLAPLPFPVAPLPFPEGVHAAMASEPLGKLAIFMYSCVAFDEPERGTTASVKLAHCRVTNFWASAAVNLKVFIAVPEQFVLAYKVPIIAPAVPSHANFPD